MANLASMGIAEVTEYQRQQVEALVDNFYPAGDTSLGCTDRIMHEIHIHPTKPIKQKHRPVSRKIEEAMHSQVRKLLDQGIIKHSTSSWASPVVMVKKGDGYRFCVDYRKLNAVTKTNAYPLPNMDGILRKLQGAKYISTIDLSSAYHQVKINPEHTYLTAFVVPGMGLFEWTRMPFGLVNGPSDFQELSDEIIGPELEPFAFSYIDDMIIATDTFEKHLEVLKTVLQRLKSAGLTINREKSHFCKEEVRYLGVLVDRNGIRPDPERIRPILDFPVPKTLKQLRRFNGMASWHRKFLPDFADVAEPLTRLTRKNTKFLWGNDQQHAFETIKSLIASAPTLFRPDHNQSFVLHTDASDIGLGAILTQVVNGQERILEYASRILTPQERNYSVTERECLAVIWALKKFRPYVEGYKIKVVTDHSSLRWLCNLRDPTGRLARWALNIQSQEIEFEHRKGSKHEAPDALSRMFEEDSTCSITPVEVQNKSADKWYQKMYNEILKDPHKYKE